MTQRTKVQLLPAEMELVGSPDIILTKNAILQKIKSFFEDIQLMQQEIIKKYVSQLPGEILKVSPKISRGENYKGLPWLVLDNPRHFEHNNIFAIRTMFWWGNFFSITLHISGRYKKELLKKLKENIPALGENNFYIYSGEKEWEHDMDPEFYKKISTLTPDEFENALNQNAFLKIAVKFPIDPLVIVQDELCRNYELVLKCCS